MKDIIKRDQNGVVFFKFVGGQSGFMSKKAYEELRSKGFSKYPEYLLLPVFDSRKEQNIVEVG